MSGAATIRAEIHDAHEQLREHFARPGEHWSSAERSSIVSEVRRARSADPMPPWVAPSQVDGLIDPVLPE